jgi:RimJ/RimL family protein N-acetyltransferase
MVMHARLDVQLRDIADGDMAGFFELHRDERAARIAAFGTRDPDAGSLAARWKKSLAEGTTQKAIVLTKSGEVVGYVATFLLERQPQVTYWIARPHWGRGIATEALRQLLQSVSTRPLYASAASDNAASLRVLQKCGFVVRGAARAFASARGEEVEEVLLELR